MNNPYLAAAQDARLNGWRGWPAQRNNLVTRYSWAIPDEVALNVLATHAPLLEIGAGTGYWAWLLREMGVDILAYDEEPPVGPEHGNVWHRNGYVDVIGTTFTEVLVGGPPVAKRFPERTLFLCWPPYELRMAERCLRAYTGQTFIYVGKDRGGCTAEDGFFDLLDAEWERVASFAIPQWDGMHDDLSVYQRVAAKVGV